MFYLDAHWWENIPLKEELRLILGRCSSFAIVIDDFRVPGDAGFGYDAYEEYALEMESIAPVLAARSDPVSVWYPAYSSTLEIGAKRGMVILATADYAERISSQIPPELLQRCGTP
jgi:hypothetical protein